MRLTRAEIHPHLLRAMMPVQKLSLGADGHRVILRKRRWWLLPRTVDSEIVGLVAPELMPPWERSLYAVAVGHIAGSGRPEPERRRTLRLLTRLYDRSLKGERPEEAIKLCIDVGAAYFGPEAEGWDLDKLAHRIENWPRTGYHRESITEDGRPPPTESDRRPS